MDKIKIKGGANLFGSINIPGSKNAALPVMVSSLLSKENLNLHNLPKLQDMNSMISLLRSFGVSVNQNNTLGTIILVTNIFGHLLDILAFRKRVIMAKIFKRKWKSKTTYRCSVKRRGFKTITKYILGF